MPIAKGNLQWTSGLEYQHDKISEKRVNPLILAVNQKSNIFGAFTQADWRISPKVKVLGGLRLDNVTSDILKSSITVLNPRASVLYNIDENFIARASYGRGFRAPFFYSEDVHSELPSGEVRRVKLSTPQKRKHSDSFYRFHSSTIIQHEAHQFVAMIEAFIRLYTTVSTIVI